jgi:orotate phosphoribosyltransferase
MKKDAINIPDINKNNLKSKGKLNKELLSKMINIPGFLNYDLKGKGVEVKPGRFSPVYINMKATWTHPEILFSIAERLTSLCNKSDCIVGIESGGSPYASLIAKDLKVGLILARKEAKEQMGILTGFFNGKEKK